MGDVVVHPPHTRREAAAETLLVHSPLSPGTPVIPYLPPLLQEGRPYYFHLVELGPTSGSVKARLLLGRYAWASAPGSEGWILSGIDPLELKAFSPTPYVVAGPLALNPECPQAWTVLEAESARVSITAVPRKPSLPTIHLFPGAAPPDTAPYNLALPPTIALPRTDTVTCRIETYPLSESCTFALKMRLFSKGILRGETPFLFHATVRSPKAWEISRGRKISEVDPSSGNVEEVVEATYESGEMSPVVTVFSGRMTVVFVWQPDPRSTALNAAALHPEQVPSDLRLLSTPSLAT